MNIINKEMLWRQFSTTIDSFENALHRLPGGTLGNTTLGGRA